MLAVSVIVMVCVPPVLENGVAAALCWAFVIVTELGALMKSKVSPATARPVAPEMSALPVNFSVSLLETPAKMPVNVPLWNTRMSLPLELISTFCLNAPLSLATVKVSLPLSRMYCSIPPSPMATPEFFSVIVCVFVVPVKGCEKSLCCASVIVTDWAVLLKLANLALRTPPRLTSWMSALPKNCTMSPSALLKPVRPPEKVALPP